MNSQGRTRQELMDNLRSALKEALEMNQAEALAAVTGEYEEGARELRDRSQDRAEEFLILWICDNYISGSRTKLFQISPQQLSY